MNANNANAWHFCRRVPEKLFRVKQAWPRTECKEGPDMTVEKIDDFSEKPSGFWFSLGNTPSTSGWHLGCEEISYGHGNIVCKVDILSWEKICVIKTYADMCAFVKKYATGHYYDRYAADRSWQKVEEKKVIDWSKVEKDFDGIFFDDYKKVMMEVYSRGHRIQWFNGLDCSSGCIWNPVGVIRGLERVEFN